MSKNKLSSIERNALIESHGKRLWFLRSFPSHAAYHLAGTVLPPHERYWIELYMRNLYRENNIIASRGTSKSFCHGSFAAPLDTLLHKSLDTLVVSASGFRGGKLLLEDAKRMILGELRSQRLPGPYLQNAMENQKIIRQEPDRWMMKWLSHSTVMTVPSNNQDSLRGIRVRKAVIDERNFFDGAVVQVVIRPMMNVGGEFEKIASSDDQNSIYQISTIDYTFRDWWKEIDAAVRLAARQYEAMEAISNQDWDRVDNLFKENKNELSNASFSFTKFDYTDLIIPTVITDDEGAVYDVKYPLPPNLVPEDVVKWDERDQCFYTFTYPVDKKSAEEPLLNGTMDEDLWLAENRNMWIEAAGAVYPDALVRRGSEFSIYKKGEIADLYEEFFPPVLYSCGDPCVVGVDYARERDDFAIVVFRLGPCATGKFSTEGKLDSKGRICYGATPWSSVIWAESWPHTTAAQAADKVRELYQRFNILNTIPFSGVGGIGMDFRGGGSAVRDELANPKPELMSNGEPNPSWKPPIRIYDPEDESYAHYATYEDENKYWSGLKLLTPSNAENWEWTRYTKAALEQSLMYIGYWEAPNTWAQRKGILTITGQRDQNNEEYTKWLIGYTAIKKLKNQLVRLQTEMTPSGLIRVYMPGAKGTEEGKKDLYSAFIYGWNMARQHIINATKKDDETPDVEPILVNVNSKTKGYARLGWNAFK
jgi:hypothetical protein